MNKTGIPVVCLDGSLTSVSDEPLQILLDMDGVLVPWFEAAFALLNRVLGRNLTHADAKGNWKLDEIFEISSAELWQIIEAEDDFWINLKPYPWAVRLLAWLQSKGEVTIASTPSCDPRSHKQKIESLGRHFGLTSDDAMLGKKKYLMANSNHVLIDDFEHNVDEFRAKGGKAILLPSGWNASPATEQDVFRAIDDYFRAGA